MKRKLLALIGVLGLTACTPWELNEYGAHLRGAPVTVSYRGHPFYVTGGATYSEQQCLDGIAWMEPQIDPDTRWRACQVNRTFEWGSLGFTTNATR